MPYSILSLDGGGSWALIQARVLQERYGSETTGHEVLRKYDLVIANSGGSLVLSMLCANKKLSEIVEVFNKTDILQEIFKKKLMAFIPIAKGFLPNYRAANKFEVFKKFLNADKDYGNMLLDKLPKEIGKETLEIVITGFDYDSQRATYFRSNPKSKLDTCNIPGTGSVFMTVTLAQAIHASSNAPVMFFDEPAQFPITTNGVPSKRNRLYWDGAVGGNNNPVKSGLLEAIGNNHKLEDIRIVSLGTSATITPILYGEADEPTTDYDFLVRRSKVDSFGSDVKKMATAILSDPPDAATYDAHIIMNLPNDSGNAKLIRINPLVKPILKNGKYIKPGLNWHDDDIENLFTLDMAIATKDGIKLLTKLCDDFFKDAFDNQGIRIGGKSRTAIIGHKYYSQAMKDWMTWEKNN
jgi:uncharacterized protein